MSYRIRRGLFPGGAAYSKRIQEFSGNLVAHWPLNERSGSVAYDLSGNGLNGTITTATLGQTGIGDGLTSMSFDGTNDYIDISAIASNLVTNGGFETAGAGDPDFFGTWTEIGAGAGDATADEGVNIHTGSHAAKLTRGNDGCFLRQNITSIIPGAQYKYRFWTRGDGTVAGNYAVYDVTNSAWITASSNISTAVTAAVYAKVDYEFTAPAGCVQVGVYVKSPQANGDAYFDTVSLRRTDIPTFDPHEGSMIVWAKVSAAGVWADGSQRRAFSLTNNDFITLQKDGAVNNKLEWFYRADGTNYSVTKTSVTTTGWFCMGVTWSLSGTAAKFYYNGAQEGATGTIAKVWANVLISSGTLIGAKATTPTEAWSGNLAHAQLYNTPLSADEMKYLMTLP